MGRTRDGTEEGLIRGGILYTASPVYAFAVFIGESALTATLIVSRVSDLGIEESLNAN